VPLFGVSSLPEHATPAVRAKTHASTHAPAKPEDRSNMPKLYLRPRLLAM
jgi:hypothetical protein